MTGSQIHSTTERNHGQGNMGRRHLEKQLADTQRQLVAVKGQRAEFRRSLRQVTRERDRALRAAAEAATARDPPGSAPSSGD